jgi:hypothetical protein
MADYPIQVATNAVVNAATGEVGYPTDDTRAAAAAVCRLPGNHHPHAGPCGPR